MRHLIAFRRALSQNRVGDPVPPGKIVSLDVEWSVTRRTGWTNTTPTARRNGCEHERSHNRRFAASSGFSGGFSGISRSRPGEGRTPDKKFHSSKNYLRRPSRQRRSASAGTDRVGRQRHRNCPRRRERMMKRGDFLIGSPESRAAARAMLQIAHERPANCSTSQQIRREGRVGPNNRALATFK